MPSLNRLVYRRLLQRARVFDQHPQLKDGLNMDTALCAMRYMRAVIDIARRHKLIPDESHDASPAAKPTTADPPPKGVRVAHASNTLQPGTILLAHPLMDDQFFRNAVVLVCKHDRVRGTTGVVINKPTRKRVKDLLKLRGGALESFVDDVEDVFSASEEQRPNAVARLWNRVLLDEELQEAGKVTLADQEGRNTLQLVIQQPEVPHDDEDQPAPKDTTLTVCIRMEDDDDDDANIERILKRMVRHMKTQSVDEEATSSDDDSSDEEETDEEDDEDDDSIVQAEGRTIPARGRTRLRQLHDDAHGSDEEEAPWRPLLQARTRQGGRGAQEPRVDTESRQGSTASTDVQLGALAVWDLLQEPRCKSRGSRGVNSHLMKAMQPLVGLCMRANPGMTVSEAIDTALKSLRRQLVDGVAMSDILRRLGDQTLWSGGPVEGGLHLLHTGQGVGGECVLRAKNEAPAVYTVKQRKDMHNLRHRLQRADLPGADECDDAFAGHTVRVVQGQADWEPGELQEEIARGLWVVARADASALGLLEEGVSGRRLWSRLLRAMGPGFADMACITPKLVQELSELDVRASVASSA